MGKLLRYNKPIAKVNNKNNKQRTTAMSETKPKVTNVDKPFKKSWYKSAVLPWAIIVIVSVGFAGIVVGWTLRSEDMSRVKSEASVMVKELKVQE